MIEIRSAIFDNERPKAVSTTPGVVIRLMNDGSVAFPAGIGHAESDQVARALTEWAFNRLRYVEKVAPR